MILQGDCRTRFRTLDLFSGIGGFALGLDRTGGFETIAFCEIDPFCRKVLAKHWPKVPCFEDVTKLGKEELDKLGRIDVICGGFPCQDISCAGKGAGIHGERSGLFWEIIRLVDLVRPRYIVLENVAMLLNRGLDEVLGALAESGYDAEWDCIPASAVGAPHRRDRVFIVAYPSDLRSPTTEQTRDHRSESQRQNEIRVRTSRRGEDVADTDGIGQLVFRSDQRSGNEKYKRWGKGNLPVGCDSNIRGRKQWSAEPDVGRVADGVPARVDRLRSLGNAVVPQVIEYIGNCILAFDEGPPATLEDFAP